MDITKRVAWACEQAHATRFVSSELRTVKREDNAFQRITHSLSELIGRHTVLHLNLHLTNWQIEATIGCVLCGCVTQQAVV